MLIQNTLATVGLNSGKGSSVITATRTQVTCELTKFSYHSITLEYTATESSVQYYPMLLVYQKGDCEPAPTLGKRASRVSVCTCREDSTSCLTGQMLSGSVSSVTFTQTHLRQLLKLIVFCSLVQGGRHLEKIASLLRIDATRQLVVGLGLMSGCGFCFLVFALCFVFFSSGTQRFPASWFHLPYLGSPRQTCGKSFQNSCLPILCFCYWRQSRTSK